jgi:PAS domain S-box-containing protein
MDRQSKSNSAVTHGSTRPDPATVDERSVGSERAASNHLDTPHAGQAEGAQPPQRGPRKGAGETESRDPKTRRAQLRVGDAHSGESGAFYGSILAALPDAVTVISSDGMIVYASEAMSTLFGVPPELVVGRSVYDMDAIHPDDREQVRASLRRLLGGELMTDRGRFRIRDVEGRAMVLDARRRAIVDDDLQVTAAVSIVTDVTEQVALERQLFQANRAKSEFLARMSHDLRTPLNSILGFAQLLELDELTSVQYESLRHISRAGSHLLELINEILDMARIDAGKLEFALEPVSLEEVVREVAVLMQPQAEQFDVAVDVAAVRVPHVLADRQRLRQAITNLVSNAIKYNRRGGLVRVDGTSTSAGRVRLTVTDTGPGIPTDRHGAVFAPFERLGAEQTTVEGTGVGLTLAKRVIEAMGGAIGFESNVGVGSTFWVELDAVRDPVEVHDSEPERVDPMVRLPGGRILYIEDDPANLIFLERALERHPGVELVPATAGRAGLALAAENPPSLVLLDVHLPDMAGIDVLRRLRSNPATADVPVVALSADASARQVRVMIEEGAVAYLYKPIDVGDLERTIRAVFAGEDLSGEVSALPSPEEDVWSESRGRNPLG